MPLVPNTCFACGVELKSGDEGRILTIGTVRDVFPELEKVNYSQREVMTCKDHV